MYFKLNDNLKVSDYLLNPAVTQMKLLIPLKLSLPVTLFLRNLDHEYGHSLIVASKQTKITKFLKLNFQGWLYGIKDGNYGLFPSDFVERMSPQAIRREMRIIAKVTRFVLERLFIVNLVRLNNNLDLNLVG